MDTFTNRQRLQKINHHLLEMVKGNFSLRIERSDKKDELEALAAAINFLTEEIQESVLHHGYKNPDNIFALTDQMVFILNRSYRILQTNNSVKRFLQCKQRDILHNEFEQLLSTDSLKNWRETVEKLEEQQEQEARLRLSFKTEKGLLLPADCKLIFLRGNGVIQDKILVSSSHILPSPKNYELVSPRNDEFSKKMIQQRALHKKHHLYSTDIESIRAAREFIMDHIQGPVPLIEIAHSVGINEYKLKRGFKELYGSTVFQFIKDQRLRKARVLVLYTNKSISAIAKLVGFKKGNHLSREFKKLFGHSPTQLRILNIDHDTNNFNTDTSN